MAASLMYKLHSYRLNPEVPAPKHFDEVYTSKNNMVRIYKTKNVNQKAKRYCKEHRGYPPVLQKLTGSVRKRIATEPALARLDALQQQLDALLAGIPVAAGPSTKKGAEPAAESADKTDASAAAPAASPEPEAAGVAVEPE